MSRTAMTGWATAMALILLTIPLSSFGQQLSSVPTARAAQPNPESIIQWNLRAGATIAGSVSAAHLVWVDRYESMPNQSAKAGDAAIAGSRAAEQVRSRGGTPGQAAAAGRILRQFYENDRRGWTSSHEWDCQFRRSGDRYRFRCEAIGLSGPNGIGEPGKQSHFLEFYDGENSVLLDGAGSALPMSGGVNDDPHQIMNHTLYPFGDPILLAEAPVMVMPEVWPNAPVNWVLRLDRSHVLSNDGKTAVWESCVETRAGTLTFARTVVSTRTWRPLVIEVFYPMTSKPMVRWRAADYHELAPGVWVPSMVQRASLTRDGRVLNTDRYSLKSASFDSRAHLSSGIPLGTELHDERLTVAGHMPLYRYGGRIPSVTEVRAWAIKRTPGRKAGVNRPARALLILLIMAAVVALCRLAGWRRRRAK